jgi:putative ABC transport system permease protein
LTDAEAIADPFAAPSVELVAPAIQGNGTLTFAGENTTTSISGVTPTYATVRNMELPKVNLSTKNIFLGRMSVVVLGPETATAIFGHADGVVGETIRIEGQPFRVIGVRLPKAAAHLAVKITLPTFHSPPRKRVSSNARLS